jgi:hypothetical protein
MPGGRVEQLLALRFNHSSFYLQKTYEMTASSRFD